MFETVTGMIDGLSQAGSPPRVLAVIDWFNPAAARSDMVVRRNARLVTTFTISLACWVPVFCLAALSAGGRWTGLTIALLGVVMWCAPLTMRRWGVATAGNITAASVFATIVATACLNGGPELQIHYGLVVVPVLASSVAGLRSALAWTLLVLVCTSALFLFEGAGYTFPLDMAPERHRLLQGLLSVAVPFVILCFVIFYEYTRDEVTRELRTREQDLAAIIDTAQDGLLVIGGRDDRRINRVNPAAERLFGLSAVSLQGNTVEVLFPGGLALQDGASLTDVSTRRADGSAFPADVTVGMLSTETGERFVAIVRDVTARHESARAIAEARDRAIQASLAKSTFLANMSHELRTPLNAILGYAELIGEEIELGTTDGVQDDLVKIGAAGRHLLSLIDHLLDLSKIEAGKLVLERSVIPLDALLDEVLTTIRPLAEASGNRLVSEVDPPLGSMISDPLRLRQALLNLLSNAAKFTEHGVITLRVSRVAAEDPAPKLGSS